MEFIVEITKTLNEFLSIKKFSKKFIRKNYKKNIFVNGENLSLNQNVYSGDVVTICEDETSRINLVNYPLNIVYEDRSILIVWKEKNIPVMGTKKHYDFHLSGMIQYYYQLNNIKNTVHLVNRLDKETQGFVIVAKTSYIHSLMKNFEIEKKYYALVEGIVNLKGISVFKIEKDLSTGKRKISNTGKECITYYQTNKIMNENTLMDIHLITGRTHQIRVCFLDLGHPLVGDSLYNGSKYSKSDLFYLKNYFIKFCHPISHEIIEIEG